MGLISQLKEENEVLWKNNLSLQKELQKAWEQLELINICFEACKICSHSYTTKDEPDKLKCRCKKCKFDDKGLRGNTKNESSSRDSR